MKFTINCKHPQGVRILWIRGVLNLLNIIFTICTKYCLLCSVIILYCGDLHAQSLDTIDILKTDFMLKPAFNGRSMKVFGLQIGQTYNDAKKAISRNSDLKL